MIDRLVYRSRIEVLKPEAALEAIFQVSVPKNARLQITGALGFSEGCFIQLLEGPAAALDDLLNALSADPRHSQMQVLLRGATQGRLLPTWSMARVDLARVAPEVERLMTSDGLGLMALMAALAHEGVTA